MRVPLLRRPAVPRGRRSAVSSLADSRRPRRRPSRTTSRRPPPSLHTEALAGTRAFEIVRSLTVEVGPRPAGSKAYDAAVAWGLRDDEGARLQQRPRREGDRAALGARRGVGRDRRPLPAAGPPRGPRRQRRHARRRGSRREVIEVPSLDALGKLDPAQVKGKIVFFDVPMERTQGRLGLRRGGPRARRGRLARGEAGRGRRCSSARSGRTTTAPRTPAPCATTTDVAKIPAAALSIPDADLLAAEVACGKPVTFRLKLGAHARCRTWRSASVVGDIPGREKPEEIVLLGATSTPGTSGTGAIDDGAGCAIMMEAARRIGSCRRSRGGRSASSSSPTRSSAPRAPVPTPRRTRPSSPVT